MLGEAPAGANMVLASAPSPPRLTLAPALLGQATTALWDHSEASLECVWLVEQLVVLPISSLVAQIIKNLPAMQETWV